MMRALPVAIAVAVLGLGSASMLAAGGVPSDPQERVAHHLRVVEDLSRHFESVLAEDCPQFGSRKEWNTYLNSEVDRVVLLAAHLEQAWVEAKRTHDKELRRTAKAPRRRLDQARGLMGKLEQCAEENGTSFAPVMVWRRIEREVPKRQAEIALPD